jgi:hypothetical protein
MIGDMYLEKDINNDPRLIMKDELGKEWVMSSENTSHGFISIIKEKEKCFYFDEKNRIKKADPFFK